jgi:hypothetical protein
MESAAVIIGIDPGTTQSAWCELYDGKPQESAIVPNAEMLDKLRGRIAGWLTATDLIAIEMVAAMGMPVGKEIFETVRWIGRFQEAWERRGGSVQLVYRREVKLFHCESARANDATIRAALLDRYGPGRAIAVGSKYSPGPCYGIKSDCWSALAVALTAENKPLPPALFREQPQQQPLAANPF